MSILRESLSDSIRHDRSLGVLTNESDVPKRGMSYLQGETTQPLSYITIPQLLRETVARFGPRDAVIFGQSKKRYSYYDLDRDVDALASGFLALGLDKGDRVGIWAPNRYEWVLTQFASARVGLVMVNINPAYRLSEVEYVLKKVRCKSLILANKFKSSNYIEMIQQLVPELESC
ncbi:MAG: fatty-acyl-CoA synthase, partial [Candidatus Azotimanducaceae bacterium]